MAPIRRSVLFTEEEYLYLSFFYLSIYSRNTLKIHLRWLAIRTQNKMSCIIRDKTIENEGSKSSRSNLTEKNLSKEML